MCADRAMSVTADYIEFCQSRFFCLLRVSLYSPDGAAIVKRIVPIRLISLICSPT